MTRHCSALMAVDLHGRFLLQHRTDNAPTWPSKWGFFGGGRQALEDPKAALVREVREELGIDASQAKFVCVIDDRENRVVMSVYFLEVRETEESLRAGQREGQGLGFFSLSEAESLDAVPRDVSALRRFAELVTVGGLDLTSPG